VAWFSRPRRPGRRKSRPSNSWLAGGSLGLLTLLLGAWLFQLTTSAAPQTALITGEIERITVTNPADVWSGGTIVVGGQNVIIPRNLLIDLPANRLTLQQLFMGAPASCQASAEMNYSPAIRFSPIISNCSRTAGYGKLHPCLETAQPVFLAAVQKKTGCGSCWRFRHRLSKTPIRCSDNCFRRLFCNN